MKLLQSNELINHITDFIHLDTQQHANRMDLTIKQVYRFTEPASLDFGGSEFKAAERAIIDPQKKQKDDEYGWWNLSQGYYQAQMNELLKNCTNTVAFLTPHKHAQKAGVLLNTELITEQNVYDPLRVNFQVPEVGCNIKENARFAALHLFAT